MTEDCKVKKNDHLVCHNIMANDTNQDIYLIELRKELEKSKKKI